jgi:hypothetical protein
MISIQLLLEVTSFFDAIVELAVGILDEVLSCVWFIVLLCFDASMQHSPVSQACKGKQKKR